MEPTQNIIHSSTFDFKYESKASALRGNAIIESIFYSQILHELEQAVANKIPKEVLIELSKLEINIGTINESELSENLAGRIRASLEKALNFKLDITGKLNKGQTLNGKESENYIRRNRPT